MIDKSERGQLRLFCYNIHKGLTSGNRLVMTKPLRQAMHELDPDFAFLQEVVGKNELFQSRFNDWPKASQHDFLKSPALCHACYGKNAEYPAGHHGNAIISRLPFESKVNVDISIYKFSRRGFLYTKTKIPKTRITLHSFCTHFGLIEQERMAQVESLCKYIEQEIPTHEPLVIGGDFNDWREKLTPIFAQRLGVKESFWEFYGSHARSFPSWLPMSCLDRIYYRNLALKSCKRMAGKPWSRLSDHLPLVADFNYL